MNRTITNRGMNISGNYNNNSNIVNVAIVDDNEKVIESISEALTKDSSIKIVGKAKNGEEAYELIRKTNPDVVILDLIMPKMDGLSLMNNCLLYTSRCV